MKFIKTEFSSYPFLNITRQMHQLTQVSVPYVYVI